MTDRMVALREEIESPVKPVRVEAIEARSFLVRLSFYKASRYSISVELPGTQVPHLKSDLGLFSLVGMFFYHNLGVGLVPRLAISSKCWTTNKDINLLFHRFMGVHKGAVCSGVKLRFVDYSSISELAFMILGGWPTKRGRCGEVMGVSMVGSGHFLFEVLAGVALVWVLLRH
ncbi:hypothetical protein BHE74_00013118 [Ensete ventricosum]|nr:hypothetical protein BHE74_00013118 [Ensete ventricosum]